MLQKDICFHGLCIKYTQGCMSLLFFSLDMIDHKSPVGCGSEYWPHECLLGLELPIKYAPIGEEDTEGDREYPSGKD